MNINSIMNIIMIIGMNIYQPTYCMSHMQVRGNLMGNCSENLMKYIALPETRESDSNFSTLKFIPSHGDCTMAMVSHLDNHYAAMILQCNHGIR